MTESGGKGSAFFAERGGAAGALALYALLAITLMVADHHGRLLDRVRAALSVAAHPVLAVVHWPLRTVEATARFVTERRQLMARASELEQRWLEAQAKLLKLAALEQENERLRALLGSSRAVDENVMVAELLAADLDPFSHRIVIDRGDQARLYAGQPVLDAGGVLGQVERVQPLTAFARLLTDPSHATPVAVNRTGVRTIAYGTGRTDQLVLRDIPRSADVRDGDLLVTSGLGGRFPPGFPVAVVETVTVNPVSAFLTVTARPTAAVDRSRHLLLVWPHEAVGPPRPDLLDRATATAASGRPPRGPAAEGGP